MESSASHHGEDHVGYVEGGEDNAEDPSDTFAFHYARHYPEQCRRPDERDEVDKTDGVGPQRDYEGTEADCKQGVDDAGTYDVA